MFGLYRTRIIARFAILIASSVVLSCWPAHAFADKSKAIARSVLDQVLSDSNAGSWRTAAISSVVTPRKNLTPARFFTISNVLSGYLVKGNGNQKLVSLNTGGNSDASGSGIQANYSSEPFGLSLFRAPEGEVSIKWRTIRDKIKLEAEDIGHCRADSESCSLEVAHFVALTDKARFMGGQARIQIINSALNDAIRYQSDLAHHGVVDLWSTPIETLKDGTGDCEDYAIAKYVALLQAGLSAEDLKVLLVRDTTSNEDHAVLTVRQDGLWLVLDNRWSEIIEASAMQCLTPVFALDQGGIQLFASRYANNIQPETTPIPTTANIGGCVVCKNSVPLLM